MPRQLQNVEGFIISRDTDSGHSHARFHLFSEQHGMLFCLIRRNKNSSSLPDLFEHVSVSLEQPQQSKSWFVKDFQVIRQYPNLARNYNALQYACEFAKLLTNSLPFIQVYEPNYQTLKKALEHWSNNIDPHIVYLKVLYRILREEGHPVKEDWWNQLPLESRNTVANILNNPVEDNRTNTKDLSKILTSLKNWINANTEFRI